MAASRKTTELVEEYDFDNWSEKDEEKAIAALKPDVKFIIVGKNFIGRFPDLTTVKLPLTLSLDDVDAFEDGAAPVDQIKAILTKIGGEDAAKEFSRQDLSAAMALAQKFFAVFEKIAKASLPES